MALSAWNREFLTQIAAAIRDSLVAEPSRFVRTIFLCGAAPGSPSSKRDRIARGLNEASTRYWYNRYEIYLPETLFDGLMSGPGSFDLLTLENMLAEAVDAVVMVLESEGTFAELGAFANHPVLSRRLVVVQDKTFRQAKTFIGRGPVRLIQGISRNGVIFADFDNIEGSLDAIRTAIGRVASDNPIAFSFRNILHAHNFVLPCLFLLERLDREEIETLIRVVTSETEQRARIIASAAIQILTRSRYISRERDRFRLTEQGMQEFLRKGGWLRKTARYRRSAMDHIRVGVLTAQRRRRRPWN